MRAHIIVMLLWVLIGSLTITNERVTPITYGCVLFVALLYQAFTIYLLYDRKKG